MPKFSALVFKPAFAQFFGTVNPPPGVSGGAAGLVTFISNVLKLLIVAGGIYAVFNLIMAGYEFISAGGDSQKVAKAWNKIWQTGLGLLIVAGSFTIAAIFGRIIFGSGYSILSPVIYGP
ncbi:MAG: hypothetical protein ABH867_00115 [Patescibacteria group bacterium]|nr:hypothetical protein [Patescibacteria group bacterium]